jgi:hypothetical protein
MKGPENAFLSLSLIWFQEGIGSFRRTIENFVRERVQSLRCSTVCIQIAKM